MRGWLLILFLNRKSSSLASAQVGRLDGVMAMRLFMVSSIRITSVSRTISETRVTSDSRSTVGVELKHLLGLAEGSAELPSYKNVVDGVVGTTWSLLRLDRKGLPM